VIGSDVADDELEELGARLARAYELSGEPPSMAALDWADRTVELPAESKADIERFNRGLRQRMERSLRERTNAPHIGGWIERARRSALLSDAQAASELHVGVLAYRQLEQGRMPIWRVPAEAFATFCRTVVLDGQLLVQWASLAAVGEPTAAYGRMDVEGEARSDALGQLGREAGRESRREFDEWRRRFIAAYGAPSGDDAPSRRS
jgi:hypothetical protein